MDPLSQTFDIAVAGSLWAHVTVGNPSIATEHDRFGLREIRIEVVLSHGAPPTGQHERRRQRSVIRHDDEDASLARPEDREALRAFVRNEVEALLRADSRYLGEHRSHREGVGPLTQARRHVGEQSAQEGASRWKSGFDTSGMKTWGDLRRAVVTEIRRRKEGSAPWKPTGITLNAEAKGLLLAAPVEIGGDLLSAVLVQGEKALDTFLGLPVKWNIHGRVMLTGP